MLILRWDILYVERTDQRFYPGIMTKPAIYEKEKNNILATNKLMKFLCTKII
jgi:hypothetical protein